MTQKEPTIEMIKKYWKGTMLFSFLFAMLFFIISAFVPPKFKATSSIAINQKNTAGMDAYREAKSSEFIARNIKEIILSNSFMKKVLSEEGESWERKISWQEFDKIEGQDERVKFWRKRVKISIVPNTGVLSISVYAREKSLSKEITKQIVNQLIENEKTLFAGQETSISIINEPYYFSKAAFPNLGINTAIGFVVGALLATTVTLLGKENDLFSIDQKKTTKDQIEKRDVFFQKKEETNILSETEKDEDNKDGRAELNQLIQSEEEKLIEPTSEAQISQGKKAPIPNNLPILENSKTKQTKKPNASDIALGHASEGKTSTTEATEEETKKRLNQLIRGEL